MIVHLRRFSFNDDVSEAEQTRLLSELRRVVANDSVAFSVIGQDLGAGPDGFTHSLCVAWEDLAALERYLQNPSQLAVIKSFHPVTTMGETLDLSDDMDPTLGERLRKRLQRARDANRG